MFPRIGFRFGLRGSFFNLPYVAGGAETRENGGNPVGRSRIRRFWGRSAQTSLRIAVKIQILERPTGCLPQF